MRAMLPLLRALPGAPGSIFFLKCPNLAILRHLLMASVTELLSETHDIHSLMLTQTGKRAY